jgi:ribosome-binding factor A
MLGAHPAKNVLLTVRSPKLTAFHTVVTELEASEKTDPAHIFVRLLEALVDCVADLLEKAQGFRRNTFIQRLCALPRTMPHLPVNEDPGSSRIRFSLVRNAFGGQVIGSTARLRRHTLGSGSPLKSIK